LGILYLGYTTIDWPKGQRKPIEYITDWNEWLKENKWII
jgi:hypothetical protein